MSGTTAIIDAVDQMVDFRDLVISDKTFRVNSWNGGALVTGLFQNTVGNVGIGTTTPGYLLDVAAPNQWVARFRKTDATNGGVIIDSASGYNPNLAYGAEVVLGAPSPAYSAGLAQGQLNQGDPYSGVAQPSAGCMAEWRRIRHSRMRRSSPG